MTTIQAWMGHASLSTRQRYMHYAPAHDEAALLGQAFEPADRALPSYPERAVAA